MKKFIRHYRQTATTTTAQPPEQALEPRITPEQVEDFAAKLEIVAGKLRGLAPSVVSDEQTIRIGAKAGLLIIGKDLAEGVAAFGRKV